MSGKLATVLQPSKFMLMTLQVISISVIMKVKDQHIYIGIPKTQPSTSDLYSQASAMLMFWCWISVIALALEFLLIFSGKTLFNDKYNLMVICSHLLGLSLTLFFMHRCWHYRLIQWVFFIAAALPLGLELMSYLYSKMNYRRNFVVK